MVIVQHDVGLPGTGAHIGEAERFAHGKHPLFLTCPQYTTKTTFLQEAEPALFAKGSPFGGAVEQSETERVRMLTDFTELTLSVIADAMPPLPKGEALAVLIRMLKSVYFFLFLASSSIRAIWSSGVVQVPTG